MKTTVRQLRSLWLEGHGLGVKPKKTACMSGGWLHAIGGADVYIGAMARSGVAKRENLEKLITKVEASSPVEQPGHHTRTVRSSES